MYSFVYILLLCALASIPVHAEDIINDASYTYGIIAPISQEENVGEKDKGCFDFATQVQPSLAQNSVQGLTGNSTTTIVSFPGIITRPGQYVLVQDVTLPSGSTGIIINSSNVTVDLDDHTITGDTNSIDGIFISPGFSNITIRNGTIRAVGRDGIRMIATAAGVTNRYIFIENMNVASSRNNGLTFSSGINVNITGCMFANNTNVGMAISAGTNLTTQNITISDSLISFNGGDGIQLSNTGNANLDNVQMVNNGIVTSTPGGNGITITASSAIHMKNCLSYNNLFTGFALSGNSFVLESCQAETNGTSGIIATGNGISLTGNFHTVLNSITKGNTGTGILLNTATTAAQIRNNTATDNNVGIQNNGPVSPTANANRIYGNYANNNTTDFIGVPNVAVSPLPATPINSTTNIAN